MRTFQIVGIWTLGAVLLLGVLTACSGLAPSRSHETLPTPTHAPDRPQWSKREAIAVVQTQLSQTPAGPGGGTCGGYAHGLVLQGSQGDAQYAGRGEWEVTLSWFNRDGHLRWWAYERTNSISPDHDDDLAIILAGC